MAMIQEHAQASRADEFGEVGEGHNGKQQKVLAKEDGRSENSSICEGQYANQPMEDAHDARQTVDDPLPRRGLDLPFTRAPALQTCTQSPTSNPDKEVEPLNRIHRIHKRISKSISRKLTKRKEH